MVPLEEFREPEVEAEEDKVAAEVGAALAAVGAFLALVDHLVSVALKPSATACSFLLTFKTSSIE